MKPMVASAAKAWLTGKAEPRVRAAVPLRTPRRDILSKFIACSLYTRGHLAPRFARHRCGCFDRRKTPSQGACQCRDLGRRRKISLKSHNNFMLGRRPPAGIGNGRLKNRQKSTVLYTRQDPR